MQVWVGFRSALLKPRRPATIGLLTCDGPRYGMETVDESTSPVVSSKRTSRRGWVPKGGFLEMEDRVDRSNGAPCLVRALHGQLGMLVNSTYLTRDVSVTRGQVVQRRSRLARLRRHLCHSSCFGFGDGAGQCPIVVASG